MDQLTLIKRIARPQNGRILLLDIDETLVHSFTQLDQYQKLITEERKFYLENRPSFYRLRIPILDNDGNINMFDFWGILRPYLDYFLKAAFENFQLVGIFTAGGESYAREMEKILFGRVGIKPDFIFHKKDLSINGKAYHKPIVRTLSKIGINTDTKKVLLIDDRIENFIEEPENCLLVPHFNPANIKNFVHDQSLKKIADFFYTSEFADTEDLSEIEWGDVCSNHLFHEANMLLQLV